MAKALQFLAWLSLNLAIFNLLPILPLDGGKMILYLLERLHPRLMRLHGPLTVTGWVLILGLLIYATVLDLKRLF